MAGIAGQPRVGALFQLLPLFMAGGTFLLGWIRCMEIRAGPEEQA
ncbi:MAG TPA: hypothetical protein VG456_09795 [Candidatus Sulfopaludibacter sp.]|nr:hypothetical protein [Candidatus Sulfopaludibacter sp.]